MPGSICSRFRYTLYLALHGLDVVLMGSQYIAFNVARTYPFPRGDRGGVEQFYSAWAQWYTSHGLYMAIHKYTSHRPRYLALQGLYVVVTWLSTYSLQRGL